jgi:hypothetical protein
MSDVRIRLCEVSIVKWMLSQELNNEYMVHIFPARAAPNAPDRHSSYAGGFILLARCSSRSGWTTNTLHVDPSGFGIYLSVDLFHTSGRRVRVIGVYLPCADKTGAGAEPEDVPPGSSLEEKIMSHVYTLYSADCKDARSWFWYRMGLLLAHTGWEHILIGDFNDKWSLTALSPFQQDCAVAGLQNHLASALTDRGISTKTMYQSFKPISDLDHILTTLPASALVGGGILTHASWWAHGPDYMLIWGSYALPSSVQLVRSPWQRADRKLRLIIDRANAPVVEEIQVASLFWLAQQG